MNNVLASAVRTLPNEPVEVIVVGKNSNKIVWSFHVPGALAQNLNIRWLVPVDCVVDHVSMVTSNDSDMTGMLGVATDTDLILAASVAGDSGVPVAYEPGVAVSEDEVMAFTGDYDGASGTAGSDFTLVITATEQ
jgi:hypothetical protein